MFARSLIRCILLLGMCYAAAVRPYGNTARADERDRIRERHRLASSDVFLPAPRELIQQLNRAKQSLEAERYSDAVFRLGGLLNEPESEDFFIRDAQQTGRMISLKSEAQRILGDMPRDGRAAYELQFGSEAQRLLELAVNDGDIGQLVNVSRKFFQTDAGQQATYLVGRYHLDFGRPLAAALTLQRLANNSGAQTFEPELSLCLAVSWFYAGMDDNGRKVLEALQRRPEARNRTDVAAPASLMADVGTAAEWLLGQIETRHGVWGMGEDQWLLYRGNAARNGSTRGDMPLVVSDNPLVNCRWRVAASSHNRMEDEVAKVQQHYAANQIPALPSLHPLAVNGVILMRTPRYLFAVDASTGKRIWLYDDLSLQMTDGFSDGNDADILSNRSDVLSGWHRRIWDDAPYGQMSSDGERVYLINKLGYPTNRRMLVGRNGINFPNPFGLKSYNELIALELASQGKRQWMIGGESGDDDTGLSGAFFLGAPLPIDGHLYILAEISGEIRLLMLDAETGKLIWRQPLIHTEESTGTIVRNALRRVAGATPSFGDGILVCPTTAGAVVAVDVATRSLLWGFEYETAGDSRHTRAFRLARTPAGGGQPGSRWSDATVTIANGKVLLTPVESNVMYCLRLFDGQLLWKQKRGQLLHLGCIHDDAVVMVGRHAVTALRLEDGKPAWTQELALPAGAMPSGRGFLSGQYFYLPTTAGELVKIDVADGSVAARQPTKQVLGNLICYDDCVISQSVESLTSFYQVDALRKSVEASLAAGEENAVTLAHHAQLMLYDDQRPQALQSLRRAYQMEMQETSGTQPSDVTRALLVDTLLQGLREDFVANEPLAAEVEQLIDQPAQRLEYLQLMTVGLQKVGNFDKAFESCVKLIDTGSDPVMEESAEHLHVRRDRWIQVQLANIHGESDRDQRNVMDQTIATRFDAAIESDRIDALRQFHQYFGFHTIDRRARLELAKRLALTSRRLEVEIVLNHLVETSTGEVAGAAAALLARLYHDLGLNEPAAEMYAILRERWGEVPVTADKTGRELWEEAVAESPAGSANLKLADWPRGRVQVQGEVQRDARQFPVGFHNQPVTPFIAQGPSLRDVKMSLQAQHTLVGKDRLGKPRFRIPLLGSGNGIGRRGNSPLTEAHAYGHMIVVSHGDQLLAIDALPGPTSPADRVLWRKFLVPLATHNTAVKQTYRKVSSNIWGDKIRTTTARTESGEISIGQIGPLRPFGVCYQRGQSLICVDPLQEEGNPVWRRDNVPAGSDLFGDLELLVVVPPNATEAMVLRQADGSSVGPRIVPPSESRWTTFGRNILTWKESSQRLALTLYDPWYEEDVWSYPFPTGAKGCLVGHDQVAVLSPDGRFVLIALGDGEVLIDQLLEPETNLDAIHVLRFAGQVVLATTTNSTPSDRDAPVRVAAAPSPSYVPLIHGRVYAFDRETGKKMWPVPAFIDQYGLPLDQPTDSPVLVFLRHETTSKNEPGKVKTTVLCLDRRDGSFVLDNTDVSRDSHLHVGSQSGTYELVVDRAASQVTLKLFERNLTMAFTDEPVPPQPPAQTGSASSWASARNSTTARMLNAAKHSIKNLIVPVPRERGR